MDKKLHRVDVVLYVMAQDEFDACWAATNVRFESFECTAEEAKSLDPGWEEAVPYNADDDRTCAEIFTNKAPIGRLEAPSIKWPAACPANTNGSSRKSSPAKLPWGLRAEWLWVKGFIRQLVSLTQQDLQEAGVSLQRRRN
jgi:hypothetical protein